MRESRVLAKLNQGGACTCLKLNLSDPRVVEICGINGLDAVWLCGEHVANDWLNLENQVRAAELYNMDTFVRVAKGSYSDYIKPFEIGATGIIIPNVQTADEAAEVVRISRFHPLGKRALDGGNRDGLFASVEIEPYIEYSNRNNVIALQIESPQAIENIEDIAAVEGYNFLFFGPNDFCHQIGCPGQFNHPEVHAARELVEKQALANGKLMITVMQKPNSGSSQNNKLFIVGADVVALSQALKSLSEDFEDRVS